MLLVHIGLDFVVQKLDGLLDVGVPSGKGYTRRLPGLHRGRACLGRERGVGVGVSFVARRDLNTNTKQTPPCHKPQYQIPEPAAQSSLPPPRTNGKVSRPERKRGVIILTSNSNELSPGSLELESRLPLSHSLAPSNSLAPSHSPLLSPNFSQCRQPPRHHPACHWPPSRPPLSRCRPSHRPAWRHHWLSRSPPAWLQRAGGPSAGEERR